MSPIKDVVAFAVQKYLEHYSTSEQSTLLDTDASLATEPAKDSMIGVLKNLQSLVNEEVVRQSTYLKRRRNQEHSRIYQLPQEVFVEIMLTATSLDLKITDAFTVMRVSKYWFDTVAQCPHIWSRLNVATRPQPGIMTMMRTLRGPVEVQCSGEPELGLDGSLAALSTLDPTRLRALVWQWSSRTEALHSFFQERNSNIVDLAVDRVATLSPQRQLDLSPDGVYLRHLDLRRVTLPWTSPRLSQLQTLSIEELHYEEPSIYGLYRILRSSPALRHIRIQHFNDANQEQLDASRPITEPIFLPELRSLHLDWVPSIIINTLVPLIRSPSCQYLEIRPQSRVPLDPWNFLQPLPSSEPLELEPSDTILDLIIGPINSQSTLDILVEHKKGNLSVSLSSLLRRRRNIWGDWDDDDTGISIKFFPSTVESLQNLFDGLISRLKAVRWKPQALDLSSSVSQGTLGTETVPALLCNFLLTFPTITRLDLALPASSTYCYALRLFEDGIPELTSFIMYHAYSGQEEWVNGIKAFLERRYPPRLQGDPSGGQTVSRLVKLYVPSEIVERLQQEWPATSLSMEDVLRDIEAIL
ncbi:hypothetical protein M407DRAFT_22748 [Tulasnella calospora MUT 4182]|uniref:F-box domain-containing protein n=1 Tax=Tulasnella calospora MUT 4182 TaxID=1051891 RepID=A0A0C3QBQ8_9AGAM|nr:hypothetical protein M407DRAFT_22748 [Tulasnella calospora MUT 4182]